MFPARKSKGRRRQSRGDDIRQWVLVTEENFHRFLHKPSVRSKNPIEDPEVSEKGRSNILEIPVDDAVVGQVLHVGQHGTGHKNKRIGLSLQSLGGERWNVPKDCHVTSFR